MLNSKRIRSMILKNRKINTEISFEDWKKKSNIYKVKMKDFWMR